MHNYFSKETKKFQGNLLTIGINDDIVNKFTKYNKNINVYSITKNNVKNSFRKSKAKTNTGKDINLKKLKKYFNKKSIDYIICDIDEIKEYIKYFVRDSIYLNNNKLYIYVKNDNIDIDSLVKKYKRYNCKIENIEYKKNKIIIIDNTESKTKKILEKVYFVKDTLSDFIDFIGNILVS